MVKSSTDTQTDGNEFTGAMCGGVINETLFESDPMAYMMAYIMPDDKFELYRKAKDDGDDKTATQLFNQFSWSAI